MNIVKVWNTLSIRTQLIVFMTLLITLLEAGTLLVINQLDKKDSEQFAREVVQTVSTSLNDELIKAPLAPSAVTFAEINHRISGFKQIRGMVILDQQHQPIMHYGEVNAIQAKVTELKNSPFTFANQSLFSKMPILAEGHTFGYTILDVDLTSYRERQLENVLMLMIIFPITLLIGLLLSWILSLNFTRPFSRLAQAMAASDGERANYVEVTENCGNEVGQLFNGYNQMLDKIETSTEALRYQSEHDALTGLYNRFYIEERISRVLTDEQNENSALIMFDLDQFNLVNNSAGFQAGDELLKMIASHCLYRIPDGYELARIGGDDFYVLVESIEPGRLEDLLKAIVAELKDFRFSWEGQAFSVSATVGAVMFKPNQYTQEQLIQAVNQAFQTAKSKGRSKYQIYKEEGQQSNQYQKDIEVARCIKEALSTGPARFELFAQPIVPLQTPSDKVSYEILLRMWDSEGKFVSPADFLPTAERYQLMAEIDSHVLWHYLEQVTVEAEHIDKLHLAHVNLAGASKQSRLPTKAQRSN